MILVNDQTSIATVPATDTFEITFIPDFIHEFNKNYILIYHSPHLHNTRLLQ